MPVLPASLFEPLWVQFSALLPDHPRVAPSHPLGCHRERIADRVVFEHVIAALVHGSGYERIATPGCSDRTIRRRLQEWATLGLAEQVHHLALQAYERMIGLDLEDLAVDGCITKAPAGGEVAGRSPVDRGKQGLKRSVLTEGAGVPLHVVPAGANRHDAPLLAPTLAGLDQVAALTDAEPGVIHLDQGYAGRRTRALLEELGLDGAIARKGVPALPRAGACSGDPLGTGGLSLDGGADAQLDEWLWQAAALHGEAARHRGVLPLPGCSPGGAPSPHSGGSPPLPLAHSSYRPSSHVVPIAGRS